MKLLSTLTLFAGMLMFTAVGCSETGTKEAPAPENSAAPADAEPGHAEGDTDTGAAGGAAEGTDKTTGEQ